MAKNHSFKTPLAYPNKALATIVLHLKQQAIILDAIRAALSSELADSIKYVSVSGDKLHIYTSNAAYATKLRFHSRILLESASMATKSKILSLQIRIREQLRQEYPLIKRKPKLPSMTIIKAIRETTDIHSSDPLSQALTRLSLTLEQRSKQSSS